MEQRLETQSPEKNSVTINNLTLLEKYSDKLSSRVLLNNVYFGLNRTIDACLSGKFNIEDQFVNYLYENTQAFMSDYPQILKAKLDDWAKANKKLASKEDQLAFLSQLTHNFECFPEEYSEKTRYKVDSNYPSSKVGRSKYWPCNAKGNLILAAGLMANYDNDPTVPAEFFEFILEKKPDFILALGKYGEDFSDYTQSRFYGDDFQYKVKARLSNEQTEKKIAISNTISGQAHELTAYNILIKDNRALWFDYKTANFFTNLCQKITQKTGIIHCASGIGRTGLFATLVELFTDPECDKLITSIATNYLQNSPIDEKSLAKLNDKIIEKLNQVRKIRPAISTKEQVDSIIYSSMNIKLAKLVKNEQEHKVIIQTLPKYFTTKLNENAATEKEIADFNQLEEGAIKLIPINQNLKNIIKTIEDSTLHGGAVAQFAHRFVSKIGIKSLGHNDINNQEGKKLRKGINNMNCLKDLKQLSEDISKGQCTYESYNMRITSIFVNTAPLTFNQKPTSRLYTLLDEHLKKYPLPDPKVIVVSPLSS